MWKLPNPYRLSLLWPKPSNVGIVLNEQPPEAAAVGTLNLILCSRRRHRYHVTATPHASRCVSVACHSSRAFCTCTHASTAIQLYKLDFYGIRSYNHI